jgi:TetR/AcrR family transcriptional repressor of nem operon
MSSRTPKNIRQWKQPRLNTRDALIRCGIELLTEKGFQSTGLEEILTRAGVPKGSFYHYFASKDEFGFALIDGYAEYLRGRQDKYLLDESVPPLMRLVNFVKSVKRSMAHYNYERGSLLGNLGQEMGALNEAYREKLEAVFVDLERRFTRCLDAAKARGDIPKHIDTMREASVFSMGWEGAILRAKLMRSSEPFDLFVCFFLRSLGGRGEAAARSLSESAALAESAFLES